MNIFECGAEKNSSHFTMLRLLNVLRSYRGVDHAEGRGYVASLQVSALFEDLFDNREDFLNSADRLLKRQLIEANTRSTETINGASHIRITSAGWYYFRYLVSSFSYLDLVLQDTPLDDAGTEKRLRDSVALVDNMSDREQEKLLRMEARFERVGAFLEYLTKQEDAERKRYSLQGVKGAIGEAFVPEIRREYDQQRTWIRGRLRENRERYAEDLDFGGATMADDGADESDK
jgi:hypothetical protein